jgi:hypothetical protein
VNNSEAKTEKRICELSLLVGRYMQHVCRVGHVLILSFCLFSCALVFGSTTTEPNTPESEYSFVYLGDMHIDQTSHHDFKWLQANYPNDRKQIENYVKNTETYTPGLLKQLQAQIDSSRGRIQMIIQGGDLTEGLCGSYELQLNQFMYAKEIIRKYLPDTAFFATKGNHDITGTGAIEAFDSFMLPWMSNECGKPISSASFYFLKGPDLFIIFDAYNNNNPDWLKKTLKENKHRYAFVVMHPPAVPYGARAAWHLFSRPEEKSIREKFLNILGEYKVIVLTAHLHKYSVLGRKTQTGSFVQFSMNSVINSSRISVKDYIEGIQNYTGSLVSLEPDFQPDTVTQRRKWLEDEKKYVTYFEYADFPGYAIVNVSDAAVTTDIYTGVSDKKWKNVNLGDILKK